MFALGMKLHAMNKAKPKEAIANIVEAIFADLPVNAVIIAPMSGRNISSKSCSII